MTVRNTSTIDRSGIGPAIELCHAVSLKTFIFACLTLLIFHASGVGGAGEVVTAVGDVGRAENAARMPVYVGRPRRPDWYMPQGQPYASWGGSNGHPYGPQPRPSYWENWKNQSVLVGWWRSLCDAMADFRAKYLPWSDGLWRKWFYRNQETHYYSPDYHHPPWYPHQTAPTPYQQPPPPAPYQHPPVPTQPPTGNSYTYDQGNVYTYNQAGTHANGYQPGHP